VKRFRKKLVIGFIGALAFMFLGEFSSYSQCNISWTLLGDDPTAVCDSTQLTTAYVLGPGDSYQWTTSSGATIVNPNQQTTWIKDLPLSFSPGDITVTLTILNGGSDVCVSSFNLTGNKVPVNAGLNQPDTCSTTELTASIPALGTGAWSVDFGSANFGDPTSPTSTVSNLAPGDNDLIWTVTYNGCLSRDTVTITNSTPQGINTAADKEVCKNSGVSLSGTGLLSGQTGLWTHPVGAGGTIVNATNANATVNNLGAGIHQFRWTVTHTASGCSVFDQMQITNNTVLAIAKDTVVCGSTANLTANPLIGAEVGNWTTTSGAIINDPANPNSLVTGLSSGANDFTWELTLGGCSDDTTITVTRSTIAVSAGSDQHLCEAVVGGLTANTAMNASDPGAGIGTWSYVSGPNGVGYSDYGNINSNTTTVTNLQQGTHVFQWTVTGGVCNGSDVVTIYNDQPTAADAGLDRESCNGTRILEANVPAIGVGTWSTLAPGPTFANNSVATTTVSNLSPGANTLRWTIEYGACSSQDDVVITNNTVTVVTASAVDVTLCTDNTTLIGSVPGVGETGAWTVTGGGTVTNPTEFNSTVTGIPRQVNTYTWTVSKGGCDVSASVDVTNYSVDAYDVSTNPVSCFGNGSLRGNNPVGQLISNPNTPANGYWTINAPGVGIIANSLNYQTTVSGLILGATDFTWTITNGVCTDTEVITITDYTPSIADAGIDTIVCSASINLSGNAVQPYETGFWRRTAGGGTIVTPSSNTTLITNLDRNCTPWAPDWASNFATANRFEWVIQYNGCESVDEVQIINGLPEPANAGTDQDVCFANGVALNAPDLGGCSHYDWWVANPAPNSPELTFRDPETGAIIPRTSRNMPFNIVVDSIQNGMTQFVWHKMNEFTMNSGATLQCELTDTVEITAPAGGFADLNAGPNTAVCADTMLLNADDPMAPFTPPGTDVVNGYWTVILGPGTATFDDSTDPNTTVRGLGAYTNILRWTVVNQTRTCSSFDDVYIHNGSPSGVSAGADQTICTNFATLSPNVPSRYTSAYWSDGGGTGVTFTNNSCTGFACDAQADNLGYGTNTLVWNVMQQYSGGYNGYGTYNPPLQCFIRDTMLVNNYMITANAGSTQYNCADTTTQLTAVLPSGPGIPPHTGTWSASNPGILFRSTALNTSTLGSDIAYNLPYGRNSLIWTVTNGYCNDNDQVIIWNNLPPTPTTMADVTICADSVNITANYVADPLNARGPWPSVGPVEQEGYITQEWTSLTGVTFTSSSSENTMARGLLAGDNALTWNSRFHFTDYTTIPVFTQTCALTDDVVITNNEVSLPSASDLFTQCGDDVTGASFNLNATAVSPPLYGSWSRISGPLGTNIVDPTLNTTQVDVPASSGTFDYIFRWTITSTVNSVTCDNFVDVTVPVRIPRTPTVFIADQEICTNSVTLQGNNPGANFGTGHWEEAPVETSTIADRTSNVTTASNIGYGVRYFDWIIDNDGCSDTATMTVRNNTVYADADDRIDNLATNDTSICVPTHNLSANNPGEFNTGVAPFPSGLWEAFPLTVTFGNNTLYNTTVSNLNNTGTNISNLTWTVTKGGCVRASTFNITNNEFVIEAGPPITSCDGNAIMAGEAPGLGNTGIWDRVGGSSGTIVTPSAFDTQITGINPGPNTYSWTVYRDGCSAYDEVVVTNSAVSADAGVDFTVCQDTTTLTAADPGTGSGVWATLTAGAVVYTSQNYHITHVSGLAENVNIFQWTVTNGICNASDIVEVTNNAPSDAITAGTMEVCSPNTIVTATPPVRGTGVWSSQSGSGSITGVTNDNVASISGLNIGESTYRWTVTFGSCTDYDDLLITNNMVDPQAGTDKIICENFTSLEAEPPLQGTGVWTRESGLAAVIINDSQDRQTAVSNLGPGTTTFRWTLTKLSCSDFDLVEINNRSVVATASDQQDCSSSFTLNGNNPAPLGATGLWTILGAGSGSITNNTQYNTTITGVNDESTTSLQWKVSNSDCADSVDITVKNNLFAMSPIANWEDCANNTIVTGDRPSDVGSGTGSGVWTLVAGGGNIVNSNNYQTSITGLQRGTNTFRWTITDNGCVRSEIVDLTNNLPTDANITGPVATEVCNGQVTLSATNPSVGSGGWTQIAGSGSFAGSSANNNLTVTNLSTGNSIFRWTTTNANCADTANITITNNQVFPSAGTDRTICQDFWTLEAQPPSLGASGYWTDLSGTGVIFDNSTQNNAVASNLPTIPVSLQWTLTKGSCSEDDIVQISNRTVVADVSATANTVCTTNATLSAAALNAGETGYWTIDTPGPVFVGNSANNVCDVTGLTPSNSYQFTWHLTNGDCSDSDNVSIFYPSIVAQANADGFNITKDLCLDTYTMTADLPSGASGVWTKDFGTATVVDNTNKNSLVNSISSSASQFTWTVTDSYGCSAQDQVTLINRLVTASATANRITCNGEVVLDGNNPGAAGDGVWTIVGAPITPGILSDSRNNGATVSDLAMGPGSTTQLQWTITSTAGNCVSVADVIITNNEFEVNAGSDQIVCRDTAGLSVLVDPGGTGNWDVVSGYGEFDNSLGLATTVRNINPGVNIFRWNASFAGCPGDDDVMITNSSVSATVTEDPVNSCFASTNLNANPAAGNGVWTVVAGTASITTPSLYNSPVNFTSNSARFKWKVSNASCADSVEVTFNNKSIDLGANSSQSSCGPTSFLIAPTLDLGDGESGVWSGPVGPVIANINSSETLVSNLASGPNNFTWTVTNSTGCVGAVQREIVNNAPSTASVASDQDICDDNTIIVGSTYNVAEETGEWSTAQPGVVIVTPSNNSTTVENLPLGETRFTWTITKGTCDPSTAEIAVYNHSFAEGDVYAGPNQLDNCTDIATMDATAIPSGGTEYGQD
jgi:hypothetical protein